MQALKEQVLAQLPGQANLFVPLAKLHFLLDAALSEHWVGFEFPSKRDRYQYSSCIGGTKMLLQVAAAFLVRVLLDLDQEYQLHPPGGPSACCLHPLSMIQPIPPDVSFIFDVSYTPTPESEADFVTIHTAKPKQFPAYVWRRLETNRSSSSSSSSTGGPFLYARVQWVVVDYSHAMVDRKQLGLGVFAWRTFKVGDFGGIYNGRYVGPESQLVDEILAEKPDEGDYNATVVVDGHVISGKHSPPQDLSVVVPAGRGKGRVLFDIERVSWPGMFAHLINDARGTGKQNNLTVTDPHAIVLVIADIDQIYHPYKGAENAAAELFWSYGGFYHGGQ